MTDLKSSLEKFMGHAISTFKLHKDTPSFVDIANEIGRYEGWLVCDGGSLYVDHRAPKGKFFESFQVWDFFHTMIQNGSALHTTVIGFIRQHNLDEYTRIMERWRNFP